MRLLLDTHIWLWLASDPDRLTPTVAAELDDPSNEKWLSAISTWELMVLAEKKRVLLEPDPAVWLWNALRKRPFRDAPITHEVALQTGNLDLLHHDPADRILAATAVVYGLTLVTADERLLRCKSFPVLPNR